MFEKELKINGKLIKVRFGAFVLKCFADEGIRVQDLTEKLSDNPGDIIPKIIYYGAVNAVAGRDLKAIDINDIYDWLDEQDGGLLSDASQELTKLFFKQLNYGVPKKNMGAGGEK